MGDSTINWTGRKLGAMKRIAGRAGLDLETFADRLQRGEKYCWRCRALHSRAAFNIDETRSDGLDPACRASRSADQRARYQARPRKSKLGSFYATTRDGDKRQARSRTNHQVAIGLLPDPNSLPCGGCGHVTTDGERCHEYHHYRGYDGSNQLTVEALCSTCHGVEHRLQENCKRGHAFTPENSYVDRRGIRVCRTCRRLRESKTRDAAWWRARSARIRLAAGDPKENANG